MSSLYEIFDGRNCVFVCGTYLDLSEGARKLDKEMYDVFFDGNTMKDDSAGVW